MEVTATLTDRDWRPNGPTPVPVPTPPDLQPSGPAHCPRGQQTRRLPRSLVALPVARHPPPALSCRPAPVVDDVTVTMTQRW